MRDGSARRWAWEEFGGADLGDVRRTRRLVDMAERAARRPDGRVTKVFRGGAEQQAAYDLLEHDQVEVEGVQRALGQAAARRCSEFEWVFLVVDGTSLTLTDHQRRKDFGSIGSLREGARGLKVLNSLALSPSGVPLGVPAQVWWTRTDRARGGYRPVHERESWHWHQTVDVAVSRLKELAPNTRPHILADREADAAAFLLKLIAEGHRFTVRSNALRKVLVDGQRCELREVLKEQRVLKRAWVDVGGSRHRQARRASVAIRVLRSPIVLRDSHTKYRKRATLTVVWVREEGTTPSGEAPLDWVLFTSCEVNDGAQALAITRGYTLRWRIEEFHRAWKDGHCRVEQTQLRSVGAVIKWATILAAVATRAEALRYRARTNPADSADTALTTDELQALLLLKQQEKKKTEVIPTDATPTIEQAVRWLADLGGHAGRKSSGPPGTTTIGRGLERVVIAAEIIAQLRATGRLR
jgi:hypothetical protein